MNLGRLARLASTCGLTLLLLAMSGGMVTAATKVPGAPHILVLFSHDVEHEWQQHVARGLRDQLATNGLDRTTVIFEEYLDAERLGGLVHEKSWLQFLKTKYAGIHFDQVLSEGEAAASLLSYIDGNFDAGRRIAINPGPTVLDPGTKAVVVDEDFERSLRVILDVYPATRRIILVGNAATEHSTQIRAIWAAQFSKQVAFEAWDQGDTLDDLCARAASLAPGDVIFYDRIVKDRNGAILSPMAVATRLAAAARVPVFATRQEMVGTGVVGAAAVSGERVGEAMADLMMGAAPEHFGTSAFIVSEFDQRALDRWHISRDRLPAGSKVAFAEPSLWEKNRNLVIVAAFETLLLLGLGWALWTRRQSMQALAADHAVLDQRVHERTAELSRSEQALKDLNARLVVSEERLNQAQAVAGLGSWYLDPQTRQIECSDEFRHLFGFAADQPLNLQNLIERFHPEERDQVVGQWNAALATKGFEIEHRIVVDYEVKWVRTLAEAHPPTHDSRGEVFGTVQDITRQKLAEREISDLLARQSAILQSPVIGFAMMRDRVITWSNPALAKITGYSTEELAGLPVRALYRDDESFTEMGRIAYQALAQQKSFRSQIPFRRKDGSEGWIDVSGAMLGSDSETSIWGYIDISEQKHVEAALIASQAAAESANRIKSKFVANMSHEIRTPLNAVLGMAYLLRDTTLDARQQTYLENIEGASHILLGVINDILDYSKIESGRLEIEETPFDLSRVLHTLATIAASAARNKDIDILFQIAPNVPHEVIGDPLRLEQVLINLTNNAIKFTQKGEVIVRVELASLTADEAQLIFCVSDTGIGISEEQQARLFQAFSQAETSTSRRFGGTGLGLVIARRLSEMMGGQLSLASQPNRGSTFSLHLALRRQHDQEVPWVFVPAHLRDLRVMILDTSPVALLSIEETVGSLGWVSQAVSEPSQALAGLIEAAYQARPFDLLLLSVRSSEARVLELLPQLTNELQPEHLPKVILIANAQEESLMKQLRQQDQVAAILPKPFTPSSLFDTVSPFFIVGHEQRQLSNAPQGKRYRFDGMRVLVAEDNQLNQILIMELLGKLGVSTTLAEDGMQCLRALQAQPDGFDLVLMDMQMPEIDGLAATRRIRGELGLERLPVVALTANAMAGDQQRCLDAGMNDFLPKPIDPALLARVLQRFSRDGGGLAATPLGLGALPDIDIAQVLDSHGALVRLAGDEAFYCTMLQSFCQAQETFSSTMRPLLGDEAQRENAARMAHSLKGVAATVGANALAAAASGFYDKLLGEATPEALMAELDAVDAVLQAALVTIADYLADRSGPGPIVS